MAKIEIQRVVRKLRLGEYAEEYGEEGIGVWVNPTRGEREVWMDIRLELTACQEELKGLMAPPVSPPNVQLEIANLGGREGQIAAYGSRVEAANEAVWGWFARMWSQGKDASGHWTMEEVRELAGRLMEDDPAMWEWLMRRTHEMQAEYRAGHKKK